MDVPVVALVWQLMQPSIPQLARQIPERPSLVCGLKVKLALQPQEELLLIKEEPGGQMQDPLELDMKVSAHSEQVLLAEQSAQLATLQTKHWFNSVFRLNPVWQAKQVPV